MASYVRHYDITGQNGTDSDGFLGEEVENHDDLSDFQIPGVHAAVCSSIFRCKYFSHPSSGQYFAVSPMGRVVATGIKPPMNALGCYKMDRKFESVAPRDFQQCTKCGFMVPSEQTGGSICSRTGCCQTCGILQPQSRVL